MGIMRNSACCLVAGFVCEAKLNIICKTKTEEKAKMLRTI